MSGHIRTIKQVQVEDVQKRRIPSKHYVYVIKVTWSDGSRHIVYRRYSRFFDFQLSLLEKFPIEGGAVDPQKRIIPFLPGKIIFGRSHIREVALKRLGQIDDYCSGLIKLPPHISEDEEVLDFFDLEPDDLTPPEPKQKQKTAETISGPTLAEQYIAISDYKKADKWDLNLKAGMILEVVEKSDSGWWFVNIDDKQGWVPSSYLERKDGLKENTAIRTNLGEDERYISTENYTPNNSDEVALEKGTIVEVLEKNLDGWWFVRSNNEEGIVPSTYLMKTEKAHIERVARASGVQIVGSMSDVSDLLKDSPNSESVHSNRTNVQHILKKQRSLERGGSLRPPPRLNSVKKASKEEMKSLKKTEDHYVTVSEFVDTVGDGITFGRGEIVEVIEKSDSGWWFVKINGQEGWAPATYIEKTHMVDIEEEDNVYQDIDDVDNNKHMSDSYSDSDDDDIYEIPEPVDEVKKSTLQNDTGPAVPMRIKPSDLSSTKQLKGVSDKEAMKRPNSRPPPPPLGLKQVNIDKDDDITSRKSSNSSSSSAPPVPPPKKKDKPASGANVESSGIHSLQDALKAKLSSDRPPQPPPKTQKSSAIGGKIHDKIGISDQKKPPIVEAKSKFSKNVESKRENNSTNNSEGPKKYSYTDVLPKNQRESSSSQESIVDVLKSKFANRQDAFDAEHRGSNNSSPVTSPKSDTSVKSFVLPPKKIQKPETPPKKESPFSTKQLKHVYNKDVANQKDNEKDGNDADNKSMNELKARFEKQRPDLSKKPVLQSKPATNVKPSFIKNRQSENSEPTVDNKLSGKASALKALFENSNTDAGVTKQKVAKTSSGGSSNSSKTSGIAAMLNSKFESDKAVSKQPQFSKHDTSSKPPLLPTKPNTNSSKTASVVPHAPLKPKNSIPPPLPSKSYNKKPAGIEKQNISPAKVDKNHNEMENKEKENVSGISKVLANKMQTNISSNKSAVPAPPAKDYEMISSYRTPCYRTVTDFVAESEEEVGFTTGEIIDVLQETGDWWFIRVNGKEGWAPATYIEQFEVETCDEVFHKQYRAVVNFATESEGEVGLSIGDVLDLIEESDSGWWFVKKDSVEGWTPSSYLEPV